MGTQPLAIHHQAEWLPPRRYARQSSQFTSAHAATLSIQLSYHRCWGTRCDNNSMTTETAYLLYDHGQPSSGLRASLPKRGYQRRRCAENSSSCTTNIWGTIYVQARQANQAQCNTKNHISPPSILSGETRCMTPPARLTLPHSGPHGDTPRLFSRRTWQAID
jgi:hypothetical protein